MLDVAIVSPPSSGRSHRRAAITVLGILLTISAIAIPFQRSLLPEAGWFMPTFGALIIMTDGLTGGLLLVQSRQRGMGRTRFLGATYLFSALIVVPHLLTFPGVFRPAAIFGAPDTPVYLWCFWHGGFALGVLGFLFGSNERPSIGALRRIMLLVAVIVVTFVWIASSGQPWLPALLQNGNYQRMTSLGIGPVIILLCLVTTIAVVVRTQCRDPLSAWLMVGMTAATLDVMLTVFGGGRFTVGWYAARVLSLVTGVTVFFSLISELMREAGRVAEVNEQLERLLKTDVLTGVANRRAFDAALDSEWKRASRGDTPLSLLMIDVDFFKKYNDRYGHPAGDECLRLVADTLRTEMRRPADLAARLGGEEFGLLLPMTDEAGAWYVAQRVREGINRLDIPHAGSPLEHVTISIGVATACPALPDSRSATLVSRADQALYEAKSSGRDGARQFRPTDAESVPA